MHYTDMCNVFVTYTSIYMHVYTESIFLCIPLLQNCYSRIMGIDAIIKMRLILFLAKQSA